MKPSLTKARAVLAALPRCGAKSHQTGAPCRLPGLGAGGKCRFHGGRSTGRPPIHGRSTDKARLEQDWIRLLLGLVKQNEGCRLSFFKPGRLSLERIEQVLDEKVRKRRSPSGSG
jgi:hypothetical protein